MDSCRYDAVDAVLEPGDTLLVFTDGVTDALDPENRQFRLDGVRKALAADSVLDAPLSPARIGRRVVEAVRSHIADRDQYDDIALVCLGRYDAPQESGPASLPG
jgi:sigma-B regulation protein RsbU (phosphoserine phosphatase)